jgi:dTDP-D-glucose 4,6-dehydratase
VFGSHDYTERLDYWIDRIANHDRVLVLGNGDNLVDHMYVEDLARALRVVAEEGIPGEAYNVAARQMLTLNQRLENIANALAEDVELMHASEHELAGCDLKPADFPLVRPTPVIIDTAKLTALGWGSGPHAEAIDRTVEEHLESDRTGRHHGPDYEAERRAPDEFVG